KPYSIRLADRSFGDQGSSGDDRTGTDAGTIQDDRAHPDQAAVLNGATVQRNRVANGYVIAQENAEFLLHAMQDAAILNIGIMSDPDRVYVATQYGVHTDAVMLAKSNISDQLLELVQLNAFRNLRSQSSV